MSLSCRVESVSLMEPLVLKILREIQADLRVLVQTLQESKLRVYTQYSVD